MRWTRTVTVAAVIGSVVILAACVLWALLADTLVTPYCQLPPDRRPTQVGYIDCPPDLFQLQPAKG